MAEYPVPNTGRAFCLALAALQQSQTLQASITAPDGWCTLQPLAAHLVHAAEPPLELETWLAVLRPSAGPLATLLPFALPLALSREQSAQHAV